MLLSALLLLAFCHSSSSLLIRLTNIYYGSVLHHDMTVSQGFGDSSYWDLQNGIIFTPDNSAFLAVDAANSTLLLASSATGAFHTKWKYDDKTMSLHTESDGKTFYLSLSSTTAGVVASRNTTKEHVFLSPVPLAHKKETLTERLQELETKLQKDMSQLKQDLANLQRLTNEMSHNASTYRKKVNTISGHVTGNVTEMNTLMNELLEKLNTANGKFTNRLGAVNATLHNITELSLPDLTKDWSLLEGEPAKFTQQLKENDLVKELLTNIQPINETLQTRLNRHRVLPISPYDWLVLLTSATALVYFVDLVRSVAGGRCRKARGRGTACIEMDSASMSHISPEYYLQDSTPTTFEFARENIKGKLQLKAS